MNIYYHLHMEYRKNSMDKFMDKFKRVTDAENKHVYRGAKDGGS